MKKERELTEREFKTLRKLLLLWFRLAVRRKYPIMLNIILFASVFTNVYFLFDRPEKQVAVVMEKPVNFGNVLDLSNYPSVSRNSQTLSRRFSILYKAYLNDKSTPDFSHNINNTRQIKKEWVSYCKIQLKKVISIKARVRDLELVLINNYPDKIDDIELIIQDKKYEEHLADMSNYYAKFISEEEYRSITNSMD
jgi:hypothetical protein